MDLGNNRPHNLPQLSNCRLPRLLSEGATLDSDKGWTTAVGGSGSSIDGVTDGEDG